MCLLQSKSLFFGVLNAHFPDVGDKVADSCVKAFYRLRQLPGIEKKPATRELINWIRALRTDPDFEPKQLAKGDLPYLGVLFKKSQDYQRAQSMVNGRRMG